MSQTNQRRIKAETRLTVHQGSKKIMIFNKKSKKSDFLI